MKVPVFLIYFAEKTNLKGAVIKCKKQGSFLPNVNQILANVHVSEKPLVVWIPYQRTVVNIPRWVSTGEELNKVKINVHVFTK